MVLHVVSRVQRARVAQQRPHQVRVAAFQQAVAKHKQHHHCRRHVRKDYVEIQQRPSPQRAYHASQALECVIQTQRHALPLLDVQERPGFRLVVLPDRSPPARLLWEQTAFGMGTEWKGLQRPEHEVLDDPAWAATRLLQVGDYEQQGTAVEQSTWGRIKALFAGR